jgi:hypothetical protein
MSSGDESPSVIQIERFAHTQFYIAFARHMEEAPVRSPCPPISMAGRRQLPNWSIITGSRSSLGMTVAFKTTFEVFTGVDSDNSLERLAEGSAGLVTDRPSNVYELCVTLL